MTWDNCTTWLKDESTGKTRKFPNAAAARAAAQRAYEKAKANGEQTVDRFYLLGQGETNSLFLDDEGSYDHFNRYIAGDR